jgi:TetR/AcrR family transcriptional regulator, mexJK operon transcriptional repressor
MLGNLPLADDGQVSDLRRSLKKQQILGGARQVFLLNGYAGASMDEIAIQAGVSKGTLYNHFDSKDDLFRSLIHAEAERITREIPSSDREDPNPGSTLRQIGIAILKGMETPATLATLRLVIGALGRFPRLGEEFLTQSLGPMIKRISEDLDTHVAAGDIQIQDTHFAAMQFARWCLAHAMGRILVPDQPQEPEADCSAWVEQVLRAFGTPTGGQKDV